MVEYFPVSQHSHGLYKILDPCWMHPLMYSIKEEPILFLGVGHYLAFNMTKSKLYREYVKGIKPDAHPMFYLTTIGLNFFNTRLQKKVQVRDDWPDVAYAKAHEAYSDLMEQMPIIKEAFYELKTARRKQRVLYDFGDAVCGKGMKSAGTTGLNVIGKVLTDITKSL